MKTGSIRSRKSRSRWMFIVMIAGLFACRAERGLSPSTPALDASPLERDDVPRYSDWSTLVNLGPVINTTAVDDDPFESKDGLTLYFVSGTGRKPNFGGRDIWVTHRASIDSPWEPPQNLGPIVNSASHEQKPTLSVDGHRLYFASDRPGGLGGFDLYVSRRHDNKDDFGWETPVNLGSPINSPSSEQGGLALLEDEATAALSIYFSSNRPTSLGGFDIYTSTLLPDGTFTAPVPVPNIASEFNEQDPAISRDGLELFFASDRPGTFGGLDLWVATRATTSDPWSTAVNLGPSINTPTRPAGLEQANDMRPAISFDGTRLYWASAFRDGNASFMFDIWMSARSKLRGAN